ncbi:uncharacterized protein LOC127794467 [Diospyros lotus]|uniref:uncharacterized protein LOC127794467 n=1 Tax=Diospyros lotus TaxID=55363 RepID=UPI00225A9697|nr:uncharacterized protein LOC127794467 [Diospyros lotus]
MPSLSEQNQSDRKPLFVSASTMGKIPAVKFKSFAEAFGEIARARVCESSGSEHSPESTMDLSDLVKSFMEREYREEDKQDDDEDRGKGPDGSESESFCLDSDLRDTLCKLLNCEDDEARRNLLSETEEAYGIIGNDSSSGFKRRLMTRLREKGFDAGLCKSKWERIGRNVPSGSYEYIDVNVAGNRYIIDVCLAGEFEIARATGGYTSLLEIFPPIFVGKVQDLKQAVRLMCDAIKNSMKSAGMHVPPWRRFRYMQAKWFGPYKRTLLEVSIEKGSDREATGGKRRSVGFVATSTQQPKPINYHYYCREDFGRRAGLKEGQLAQAPAFKGTSMLM